MSAPINMPSKRGVFREYSAQYPSGSLKRSSKSRKWIIWLSSIGILLPYTFGSTGKYVAAFMLLPAVASFFYHVSRGQRRIMACDVFVWMMALWMVAVKIGTSELLNSSEDAIAFIGIYMVARSFYFGEAAVEEFVRAIAAISVVLVTLGLLDVIFRQHVTDEFVRGIFNTQNPLAYTAHQGAYREVFGVNLLRAQSVFGHPILFGTFCSIAGILLLFLIRKTSQKVFYVGACVVGCIFSISSAAIMGLILGVALYGYDRAMEQFPWRWKPLWLLLAGLACALYLLSNHPVGWLVSHLTLDAGSGYFRISEWEHASFFISMSPFTGVEPAAWALDEWLSDSLDTVWLVLALDFGIPTVIFVLLANLTACGALRGGAKVRLHNMRTRRMRTAFSVLLLLFVFIGLTTHFWDAIWMLWALCIGIRTSLEEYCVALSARPNEARAPKLRMNKYSNYRLDGAQ